MTSGPSERADCLRQSRSADTEKGGISASPHGSMPLKSDRSACLQNHNRFNEVSRFFFHQHEGVFDMLKSLKAMGQQMLDIQLADFNQASPLDRKSVV